MDKRPNQSDREIALRKYFEVVKRSSTTGAVVFISLGALVITMAVLSIYSNPDPGISPTASVLLALGSGAALIGILLLAYNQFQYKQALAETQPQPTDSQVDARFQESRERLVTHAKNRLNLFGPESDFFTPLIIEVPTLSAIHGIPSEDLKWHKGTDGVLRFAIHQFIVIYLTERHLAAYTCDFNFIRDVPLNEATREYHYQDIISVATYEWSQSFTLPTGQKLSTAQVFKLSVASGECIEVRLENEQLRKMTQQEEVPAFGADQAVTTIRAMLRDRKTVAA
jgi:hypothetical protein